MISLSKSIKHYTPELARAEAKKAFNWREYVQGPIDEYVGKAVKEARYKVCVEFSKPSEFDYAETLEHIRDTVKELGWDYELSDRMSIGNVYLIISWEDK